VEISRGEKKETKETEGEIITTMFRRQHAREMLARCARNTFCDTYDAGRGLNLQADHGRIVDYKVVENLRQAGPNVISEVTHEFIGYFFPTPDRFLTSRVPLFSLYVVPLYVQRFSRASSAWRGSLARGHVCRLVRVPKGVYLRAGARVFPGSVLVPVRYKFRGDQP